MIEMNIFNNRPDLKNIFDVLHETRRDEILADMLITDDVYTTLCDGRTEASMLLKNAIAGTPADDLFEKYSDTIYRQEIYELDSVYKQAFFDAVIVLEQRGLLKLDGLVCEGNI